eukprot:8134912-Pyramimonas_sp.AAC.1
MCIRDREYTTCVRADPCRALAAPNSKVPRGPSCSVWDGKGIRNTLGEFDSLDSTVECDA